MAALDGVGMSQLDLPFDEQTGLTLWQLVEALEDAADAVALTPRQADDLVCRALADLLDGGIATALDVHAEQLAAAA